MLDKLRGAAGKGTPDAVLEVLDEHGSDFGELEVEEALQQLSTLAKGWSAEDKKSLHGAPGLQALIGDLLSFCCKVPKKEVHHMNNLTEPQEL